MEDKLHTWKVFEHNGKELFAYTLFGEGEDQRICEKLWRVKK